MLAKFLKSLISVGSLSCLAATPLAAATITESFHLGASYWSADYGNQGHSFDLTEGELTGTFAGKTFRSIGIDEASNTITSADVRNAEIGRWFGGAGVQNSRYDSHQVDGFGRDDFIEISFDMVVSLSEIKFSYFDAYDTRRSCWYSWRGWRCSHVVVDDDDFRWMYDLNGDGSIGSGDYISANQNANPFSAFGTVESSVFGIGAFEWNDDWKLHTVTVTYEEMAPVPLPASGLLLLAGLGGIGLMRRKRAA